MSNLNSRNEAAAPAEAKGLFNHFIVRILLLGIIFVVGFFATIGIMLLTQTTFGGVLGGLMNWLFAANSVQVMWYFTRSAGIIAYLLLWFSVVWGLVLPSKIFDRWLPRAASYDFHQFISLLSIGFILLHIIVLMLDQYLPFTLAQVLFPFISPYRPVWVGIGVLSLYLIALVTITFYMRSRIGKKAFRSIHLFSLLAYLGSTVHGFFSGTDSSLPATQVMYLGTFLTVVFLTVYWLVMGANKRRPLPANVEAKPRVPKPQAQAQPKGLIERQER